MGESAFWTLPLSATAWPVQVGVITALAVIAVSLAWWLIVSQNKSTNVRFRTDIWSQLRQGNMAVALYYSVRLAVVFGAVAYLMGRFA